MSSYDKIQAMAGDAITSLSLSLFLSITSAFDP